MAIIGSYFLSKVKFYRENSKLAWGYNNNIEKRTANMKYPREFYADFYIWITELTSDDEKTLVESP